MAYVKSMIEADRRESEELQLYQLEYLASFINPEGVKQVQGDRRNSRRVTDENFARAVASLSGTKAAAEVLSLNRK